MSIHLAHSLVHSHTCPVSFCHSPAAESTSQLQKDLGHAHEVEICRTLNEYSRLLLSIKRTLKIRKEAKKIFTDAIAVKMERYQQYNHAMETFADSNKIATKLQAYTEAKQVMLEHRQAHITISKNLITDFHRWGGGADIFLFCRQYYEYMNGLCLF